MFTSRPRLLDSAAMLAELPPVRRVHRTLPASTITDVRAALMASLSADAIRSRIRPGERVAVGVGSRGIATVVPVVATLVDWLRSQGAEPYIVPAMGSHGSATAEGQQTVLSHLGVTERSVGAPIRPDMQTSQIGEVEAANGMRVPVFTARSVLEADHVVPISRIKPHTDFRGPVESGLLKMLAIGLGKLEGARSLHRVPPEHFSDLVSAAGRLALGALPVPFGVALIEDGYEQPAVIEAIPSEFLDTREPELLDKARCWLPQLPFPEIDILIISEIGKDFSGTGMDTNVTGRLYRGPTAGLRADRIAVLDLSAHTGGNACGVGMADVVTERLAAKVDWYATYSNELAARLIEGCRLPLVALDDEEAVAVAAASLLHRAPRDARIVWIPNTLDLTTLAVSEPLWQEGTIQDTTTSSDSPRSLRFTEGILQP